MVTFIKLVCPNCGANLDVDSKLSQCFCQYCGVKILLHNENEHTVNLNIDHTNRYVDEAGLAEQETERMRIAFEREKIEHEEQRAKREIKQGAVGLFAAFMLVSGLFSAFTISGGFRYGTFETKSMAIVNIAALGLILLGFLPFVDIIKLKKSIGVLFMFAGAVILIISISYLLPYAD